MHVPEEFTAICEVRASPAGVDHSACATALEAFLQAFPGDVAPLGPRCFEGRAAK